MLRILSMSDRYHALVQQVADTYGLSVDDIEQRVASRRARFSGWLTRTGAARLVAAQSKLEYVLGIRHIAGLELSDALAAAHDEAARGKLSTLGYWPQPHETGARIATRYLRTLDAIAEAGLPSSISIKLDHLQFEDETLQDIFRHGKLRGVRVHFDAENHGTVDRTLAVLEEGLALGVELSATLPSRWARSGDDAERLIRLGVPFRVVKGQGKDPGNPKIDPRRSFLALIDQVAGRAAHVAVATHDRRVAEAALDRLLAAGTPCSLEQLRFLPRLDSVAVRRGVPVRVYVPYGRPGLPYTLTQAARRPAIVGWAFRDLMARWL